MTTYFVADKSKFRTMYPNIRYGVAYEVTSGKLGWLYFVDDIGETHAMWEEDVEIIRAGHVTFGRVFDVTFSTTDRDEANRWMLDNPEHGVIAVVDGNILIANCSDEGIRIAHP